MSVAVVAGCATVPARRASGAICDTPPGVSVQVGSHPAAPLVRAPDTTTFVLNVGEPVSVTFTGSCARGRRLMPSGIGPGALDSYSQPAGWSWSPTQTWMPTREGLWNLLVGWSCTGPASCPFGALGIITVKVVEPPPKPPSPEQLAASERSCSSNNLLVTFVMGGYATGSDFGSVRVRNRSATPCALRGRLSFVGLSAYGVPVSSGDSCNGANVTCTSNVSLAARTPLAGAFGILLEGFERDDPKRPDGMCRTGDEIAPAVLRFATATVAFEVRNYDGSVQWWPFDVSHDLKGVYGCHGAVQLVGAGIPM
jgi:hypothetical protein